jgi:SP family myo-inositol transporter-like MFS transporter 13
VIWLADFLFLVGALWQALSYSVLSMILGRVVVGLGVGVGSLIVPLYISELAPASRRGRLVVISVLFVTFGQLVAYTIGLLLSPPRLSPDTSWRWTLGLGAAPAIFQAFLMIAMPETPRWQLLHSRREDAQTTISQVYGTTDAKTIAHLLAEIQSGIPSGPRLSLLPTLKSLLITPSHRRALTIACFLQFLQQACGFNSLMYFSASLFSMLGFHSPIGVALVVAGTNAVSTLFAFHLIDRIGRRRMLLYSLTFMTISLTVCAGVFLVLPPLLPSSISSPSQTAAPLAAGFMVTAMTTFVASYAVGLGPIPWLCQSEFFAIEVRGVGTGAATATNWFWNLIISATFLLLLEAVGGAGVFTVYAVVCAGGLTVGWRVYPETGGLGMEKVQEVLAHGWGV